MVICRTTVELPGFSIRRYVAVFAITAMLMCAMALVLGANLGLFLAGMTLCALLVPFAVNATGRLSGDLLVAACVTDAVALVWLVMAIRHEAISLWHWLLAYLLLLSVCAFQFGVTGAFRQLRFSQVSASGASILLVALWLTAPIWLLHHLQNDSLMPWMQRLINVHPVMAMNAAFPAAIWTESPLAYRLLNLNQDVFYVLPPGIWPAALLHLGLGSLLIWINYRLASGRYS